MIGYMYSCLWTPILGDWTISTPIICLMVDVALFSYVIFELVTL